MKLGIISDIVGGIPWPLLEKTAKCEVLVLGLTALCGLLGVIVHGVYTTKSGPVYDTNNFVGVYLAGFVLFFGLQVWLFDFLDLLGHHKKNLIQFALCFGGKIASDVLPTLPLSSSDVETRRAYTGHPGPPPERRDEVRHRRSARLLLRHAPRRLPPPRRLLFDFLPRSRRSVEDSFLCLGRIS